MKKKILSKFISIFTMAMMIVSFLPIQAFAIIYRSGETLNPACLPTDANCGVVTSNSGTALSAPSGVTVAPQGTVGSATYNYRISAVDGASGETVPSTATTTTIGNATLSATNYNSVSWSAVSGATYYKVYGRTSGSELFIASTTVTSYNDTGSVTPSGTPPTSNTTGAINGNVLSITSNGTFGGALTVSGTATSSIAGALNSGNIHLTNTSSVLGLNAGGTRLRLTSGFADTGDNNQGASVDLHSISAGGNLDLVAGRGGAITFWTSTSTQAAQNRGSLDQNGLLSLVNGLSITGTTTFSGNVGIGTTTPDSVLHVAGSAAAAGANALQVLNVVGGTGGAHNGTVAGIGSGLVFAGGTGGGIGSGSLTAGAGGAITLAGGAGGSGANQFSSGRNGGAGGNLVFSGGTGGNVGNDGAGSGSSGAGGSIYVVGGLPGTPSGNSGTGAQGNVYLAVNASGTAIGNVGIATTTATNKLTIGADGTLVLPAIGFAGDSNTGLYHPAADTLSFVAGGVEALRLSVSGRLGLGTTTPSSRLHVVGENGTTTVSTPDGLTIAGGQGVGLSGSTSGPGGDLKLTGGIAGGTAFGSNFTLGRGGALVLTGGQGGNGDNTYGTGRIGGVGGYVEIVAGKGGNMGDNTAGGSATGNGGNVFIVGGAAGDNAGQVGTIGSVGNVILGMAQNGTARGNVGIGTTNPITKFNISGAGQATSNLTDSGNTGASLFLNDNTQVVGSGGVLLFGGSGTNVNWFAGIKGLLTDGTSNTAGDIAFSTRGLPANTALGERMRITASGNVGIGTSTPSQLLHIYRSTDGVVARFTDANGDCDINPTNTALVCASDVSLKKNIVTMNGALEKMLALNPVLFDWNKEENGTGNHLGFIAQDVEKLFPALVSTNEQGLKSLAYSNFAPILVSAMQEQFGGLRGLKFTSVTDYGLVFSTTSSLDELAQAKASDNFISDPIGYIRKKVEAGVKIARSLAAEKIVAVNGYFKRIFANELCLTDSSGAVVCITGDQLKNLGGSTLQTTDNSSLTTSNQNTSSNNTTENATTTEVTSAINNTDSIATTTTDSGGTTSTTTDTLSAQTNEDTSTVTTNISAETTAGTTSSSTIQSTDTSASAPAADTDSTTTGNISTFSGTASTGDAGGAISGSSDAGAASDSGSAQ